MDLRLFGRVLYRFRVLVGAGLLLAVLLATFSYVKVSFAGGLSLKYRSNEQWISYTRLFVTQPGSGWFSSNIKSQHAGSQADQATNFDLQQAAETRLSSLAIIYSNLVNSDRVLSAIRKSGPIHGSIEAAALPVTTGSDSVLPIISIAGISATPKASLDLSARAANSLRNYISQQQTLQRVSPAERIELEFVNKAGGTKLWAGRKKTIPIVVFLTVTLATLALAFTLENLRPRIREAASSTGPPVVTADRVRQTAS